MRSRERVQAPVAPAPVRGPRPRRVHGRRSVCFVGRSDEIHALTRALDGPGEQLAIAVVSGEAGVGKTALAEQVLHKVAHRFLGGLWSVDLGGWSGPAQLDPLAILCGLLRLACDIPPGLVPDDLPAAIGLWRSVTGTRPVGLLVNDATRAGDVEPLLPGAGRVVVTSRRPLRSLSLASATRLRLSVLSQQDAADLVTAVAGGHTRTSPWAVAALVEACGHLPLAVEIAAAQLVIHPHQTIEQLVTQMIGKPPLTTRNAEESPVNTGQVNFGLTAVYQRLPESLARTVRYLASHPGPEVSIQAAAALLDIPPDATAERLRYLCEARIAVPVASRSGWYQLHESVAELARRHSNTRDNAADFDRSQARLLTHYLRMGAAASRLLEPNAFRVGWGYGLVDGTEFAEADTALAWLDNVRDIVLALQVTARELGRLDMVWMLAETYWVWCQIRREHGPWVQLCERAISAAKLCNNPMAQARMTALLVMAHRDRGDHADARYHAEKLLTFVREMGDWFTHVTAVEQLAALDLAAGDHAKAVAGLDVALGILDRNAAKARPVAQLHRLYGRAQAAAGKTADAREHFDRALQLFADPDAFDTHGIFHTLVERAKAELADGQADNAQDTIVSAIERYGYHPRPLSTAEAHLVLGRALHQLGDRSAGEHHCDKAVELYRQHAGPGHPLYIDARALVDALPGHGDAGDPQ